MAGCPYRVPHVSPLLRDVGIFVGAPSLLKVGHTLGGPPAFSAENGPSPSRPTPAETQSRNAPSAHQTAPATYGPQAG